jgi:hypothetical protein
MRARGTISAALVAASLGGCATLRANPTRCRVVTTAAAGTLGALVGGLATGAADVGAGGIVAASVGGAAVGTLAGLALKGAVCEPSEPAAAAPPPPP